MKTFRYFLLIFSLLLILVACQQNSLEPGLSIFTPNDNSSFQANQSLSFSGRVVNNQRQRLPDNELSWELKIYNADKLSDTQSLSSSQGQGEILTQDYGDDVTKLELCLSAAGFDTSCLTLLPEKIQYSFESEPTGLSLTFNNETLTTPFEKELLVGAVRELSAPAEQQGLEFVSWADAGILTRNLEIDSEAKTLKAFYEDRAPTITCGPLAQEAEAGLLFGEMEVFTRAQASGGSYISSDFFSEIDFTTQPDAKHRVDYCFEISTAGSYRLKTWVAGLDTGNDSFLVQVNQGQAYTYSFFDVVRNDNPYPAFSEDYLRDETTQTDPVTFSLEQGEQRISIYLREDGSELDKLELELVPVNENLID